MDQASLRGGGRTCVRMGMECAGMADCRHENGPPLSDWGLAGVSIPDATETRVTGQIWAFHQRLIYPRKEKPHWPEPMGLRETVGSVN